MTLQIYILSLCIVDAKCEIDKRSILTPFWDFSLFLIPGTPFWNPLFQICKLQLMGELTSKSRDLYPYRVSSCNNKFTRMSQDWLMRREATCVEQMFYRVEVKSHIHPIYNSSSRCQHIKTPKKTSHSPLDNHIFVNVGSFDSIKGAAPRLFASKAETPPAIGQYSGVKTSSSLNSTSKLIISKLL